MLPPHSCLLLAFLGRVLAGAPHRVCGESRANEDDDDAEADPDLARFFRCHLTVGAAGKDWGDEQAVDPHAGQRGDETACYLARIF